MKYSDDLYQLVKSMSKQEKSYFKKYALAFSDEESSNYIKLFDEIQKQISSDSDYDEMKIKEKEFRGKFLKNLSYHKNYLYGMILNCLLQYHKDNYDVINLRNMISKFEILFDKNMFFLCRKILVKAKEIAIQKEQFTILHELLLKEKLLNKFTLSISEFSAENKKITLDLDSSLEKLKNNLDYINLNDLFMIKAYSMGNAFVRNQNEIKDIDRLFKNEFLTDDTRAKTFRSRNLLYGLKAHYALIKKDFESMYKYNTMLVGLWEKKISSFLGRLDNYLIALNNLMNAQIRLKKYDEFDLTADKFNSLQKTYARNLAGRNKTFMFYSHSVLTMSKYFAAFEFDKLISRVKEAEDQMKEYEFRITLQQRIIIYYFLGLYNFVFRNYEKCIYWMGKIIGSEKSDFSENYQCFARILHLLSYFELEYFDSLEYTLKSTYHFLKKKERVFKYENIVLKYLRKSFRLKTHNELIEMLREMKFELDQIAQDDFEQNAFDIFDISQWLESKIEKRTMLEVIAKH